MQSVKLLSSGSSGGNNEDVGGCSSGGVCATVAFVDICSASKAHKHDHRLEDRLLKTTYYEPQLSALATATSSGSSSSSCSYSGGGSGGNSSSHLHRQDLYTSSAPSQSPQSLGSRSPRFSSR